MDRNNYEIFLVDFAEGLLDNDMRRQVEQFLLLNPDIQAEFDLFLERTPVEDAPKFGNKENLKKIPMNQTAVDSEYFQQLCVNSVEGILSAEEQHLLNKMVASDVSKMKELTMFQKTRLTPQKQGFSEQLLLKHGNFNHVITDQKFENYCVASMEGWLDMNGLNALNNYLTVNPEQLRVYHTYLKTKLQPDLRIVFNDKRRLKKFSLLSPAAKKVYSFAASIVAVLVLGSVVFYTATHINTTNLAGSMVQSKPDEPFSNGIREPESMQIPEPLVPNVGGQKKVLILTDLDEFVEVNTPQIQLISNIQPMQPVEARKIAFAQVEQVKHIEPHASSYEIKTENLKNNQSENNSLDTKAWQLAQAGISGFNKLTNTQLKVEKDETGNKTKIGFNSRYLSFSTQVKIDF